MAKMMKKISFLLSLLMCFYFPVPIQADPVPAIQPTAAPATEDLITLNFNQADIQSVFRILAMKGNVNIVAGPEITGEVTMQLQDVPWENAFKTIVRTYGYTYEKDGNIYYVLTPEAYLQSRTEGITTSVVTLQYANINQVAAALRSVVTGITIDMVEGSNQVLVTGTPTNLEAAEKVIQKIDTRQPQVHIDAKIVRTALAKGETLGINWNISASLRGSSIPTTFPFAEDPSSNRPGKFLQRFDYLPQGQTNQQTTANSTSGGGTSQTTGEQDFPQTHSFPFVEPDDFTFGTIDFSQFTAMLNMLKSRANTKIISNPRIVVLSHQDARVQAGREIGLPTFERNESTGSFEISGYEPRNDGIALNVTPHITNEGEILLTVRPELTRFLGFQEVIQGQNVLSPEFETTTAETEVMINSGDTLVIGGLISESETDARSKVPYLSRIPGLGWLFKHISPRTERSETIIFVTVTIADDVFNKESLEKWRQAEAEYEAFQKFNEEEFVKRKNSKKDKAKEEGSVTTEVEPEK